jgi:hypothetical protein
MPRQAARNRRELRPHQGEQSGGIHATYSTRAGAGAKAFSCRQGCIHGLVGQVGVLAET